MRRAWPLLLVVVLAAWWLGTRPRSPRALFETRCSQCHELPDLCRFAPAERPGIVETMRSLHGASSLIGEHEAAVIAAYLEHELTCP